MSNGFFADFWDRVGGGYTEADRAEAEKVWRDMNLDGKSPLICGAVSKSKGTGSHTPARYLKAKKWADGGHSVKAQPQYHVGARPQAEGYTSADHDYRPKPGVSYPGYRTGEWTDRDHLQKMEIIHIWKNFGYSGLIAILQNPQAPDDAKHKAWRWMRVLEERNLLRTEYKIWPKALKMREDYVYSGLRAMGCMPNLLGEVSEE